MRNVEFTTGEYYHIYNRGANKAEIFLDDKDRWKFFDGLRDLNNKTLYDERLQVVGYSNDLSKEPGSLDFRKLRSFLTDKQKVVEVISYSFLPNHFHLILKQLVDRGISNFMHKVGTSYTNYFNKKYKHSGHIFQGPFKAIHIDNDEYLLWLIGYVNGNAEIHNICESENYDWSSFRAISKELGSLEKGEPSSFSLFSLLGGLDIVVSQFKSESEFKSFVQTVVKESSTKKEMKGSVLEFEIRRLEKSR